MMIMIDDELDNELLEETLSQSVDVPIQIQYINDSYMGLSTLKGKKGKRPVYSVTYSTSIDSINVDYINAYVLIDKVLRQAYKQKVKLGTITKDPKANLYHFNVRTYTLADMSGTYTITLSENSSQELRKYYMQAYNDNNTEDLEE